MARLVLNHSTHCEGLIPVLRRLASMLPEGSVIPARISVARPAADRSLRVNVTGPGRSRDSFRLLAKRGTVVQEVALPRTLTLTLTLTCARLVPAQVALTLSLTL